MFYRCVELPDGMQGRLDPKKGVPGLMYQGDSENDVYFVPFAKSKRHKPVLLKNLRGGWVKESRKNIIVHDSVPKKLGKHGMIEAFRDDFSDVVQALENREIVETV